MRPLLCTLAVVSCLALPSLPQGPQPAEAQEAMVLRLQDSVGQARTMVCRPAEPGEVRPVESLPASPVPSPATSTTSAAAVRPEAAPCPPAVVVVPASPVPARTVPVIARSVTRPNPCPPPARPNNLGLVPGASLYADPAAVAAAWECYVPRQMAYAPRPWRGPDPAVHSPLPPLRRTWRPAVRATAKPAPAINIDVLATMIQTLCPPASTATSAASALGTPTSALPAPHVETRPAAVRPQATTQSPASQPESARPVSLLDASPVRPNAAGLNDVYSGPAPDVRQ